MISVLAFGFLYIQIIQFSDVLLFYRPAFGANIRGRLSISNRNSLKSLFEAYMISVIPILQAYSIDRYSAILSQQEQQSETLLKCEILSPPDL